MTVSFGTCLCSSVHKEHDSKHHQWLFIPEAYEICNISSQILAFVSSGKKKEKRKEEKKSLRSAQASRGLLFSQLCLKICSSLSSALTCLLMTVRVWKNSSSCSTSPDAVKLVNASFTMASFSEARLPGSRISSAFCCAERTSTTST